MRTLAAPKLVQVKLSYWDVYKTVFINSVGPDQTASLKQSDLGQPCLPRHLAILQ